LIGLYPLVAALDTSAVSHGQTHNIVILICPHFFEHTFSYFVVSLVGASIYESVRVQTHP